MKFFIAVVKDLNQTQTAIHTTIKTQKDGESTTEEKNKAIDQLATILYPL